MIWIIFAARLDVVELKFRERIRKIRDSGVTIALVEHDMKMVMGISDRTTVLNYGRKIASCLPHEIRQNQEVVKAYLGREDL